MRAFITTLAAVGCFAFLIIGHFYWKEKTSIAGSAAVEVEKVEEPKQEETPNSVEKDLEELDIFEKTKHWPKEAQQAFQEAVDSGRSYKIAIVGSPALGKENGGWSRLLENQLVEAYGDDNIEVEIFEYDLSSDQFISGEHDKEVIGFEPDLILFEPFKLIDNKAAPQHNSDNVRSFLASIDEADINPVVILQPAHPIYDAKYYPLQVKQLETLAEEEGLEYLNHWSAWPDGDDPALREYLDEEQDTPNEQGHEVWFEYLKDYFVAE